MTNPLHDVLLERADTALTTDPQAFLALVRERAEQRHRARRNATAAAGGAVLVAALVTAALVLPSSDDHPHGAPAGGPGATQASAAPTGADASADAARSAAASAASRARLAASAAADSAASTAASAASTTAAATVGSLTSVSTPAAAAVAIGLVPTGWHYVGHQGPVTYYGPADMGPSNDPDFTSVIVVDVHERFSSDASGYDLTIGGRQGRYGTDSGVTGVSVIIDATTELDVQVPVSAPVSRDQALRIAATLDLRSKAEKTHG